MELDPHVKGLLEKLAAVPPLNTMPPAQSRFVFEATAPGLDLKNVPIAKTEDRMIPGPAGQVPVRIYTPEKLSGTPAPAVLFFHGGGFVIGSRNTHDAPCRFLANHAGAIVVSVDYRLAPEHKFPAAVDDCVAALAWLRASASELNIDLARIAVAGDSAGGNLSAVVALADRDAKSVPPLKLQCLIYPVTDGTTETESRKLFAKGYFLESDLMEWFFVQYARSGDDRNDWRLSPLLASSHANLPEAMVITAAFDPLRDEGEAYADKLSTAGVKVTYKNYDGLVHGFFNMGGVIPAARVGLEEICDWIKAHI